MQSRKRNTLDFSLRLLKLRMWDRRCKQQPPQQQEEVPSIRKPDNMTINKLPHCGMRVTEVGEFLRNPPAGFSVETLGSCYRVHNNKENNLVLIDDFESCRGKIVFQKSLGR